MSTYRRRSSAPTGYHSNRVFPKSVVVGSRVLIRQAAEGGWFSDAGTVARGKHGRVWCTVASVTPRGNWYDIDFTDDAPITGIGPASNSKVIALAPKPEVQT